MKFFISVPVFFIVLVFPLASYAQDLSLQKEVDKLIYYEANIDQEVVTGILVGVLDGEERYYSQHGLALSPDSLYELGSVTKPIVYWLVMQALDSLGIGANASICEILPDSLCQKSLCALTIHQVLSHRAGLPRLPLGTGSYQTDIEDPYREYTAETFASALMPINPVPNHYAYSHVGYAMMYWLFEAVGGLMPFSKHQLEQLDMYHTFWEVEDSLVARGQGMDGKSTSPWHCNVMTPALGLKSNLGDLLNFISARSTQLSANEKHNTKSRKRKLNSLAKKKEYILDQGWFLVPGDSSITYYHNGRTGGHHVSIAFIPDRMKGVVVISNSSLGTGDLSRLVLEMISR